MGLRLPAGGSGDATMMSQAGHDGRLHRVLKRRRYMGHEAATRPAVERPFRQLLVHSGDHGHRRRLSRSCQYLDR